MSQSPFGSNPFEANPFGQGSGFKVPQPDFSVQKPQKLTTKEQEQIQQRFTEQAMQDETDAVVQDIISQDFWKNASVNKKQRTLENYRDNVWPEYAKQRFGDDFQSANIMLNSIMRPLQEIIDKDRREIKAWSSLPQLIADKAWLSYEEEKIVQEGAALAGEAFLNGSLDDALARLKNIRAMRKNYEAELDRRKEANPALRDSINFDREQAALHPTIGAYGGRLAEGDWSRSTLEGIVGQTANFAAQGIGQIAGTVGGGLVGAAVTKTPAGARAGAAIGNRVAGAATGAALVLGSIVDGIAEDILGASPEEIAKSEDYQKLIADGLDDEHARASLIQQAARDVAPFAAGLGAVEGLIGPEALLARTAILRQAASKSPLIGRLFTGGLLSRVGKGLAFGAAEEFVEEGAEQFTQNVAERVSAGLDVDLTQDVLANAIAGAGPGAFFGGAGGIRGDRQAQTPTTTPTPSGQPSTDGTTTVGGVNVPPPSGAVTPPGGTVNPVYNEGTAGVAADTTQAMQDVSDMVDMLTQGSDPLTAGQLDGLFELLQRAQGYGITDEQLDALVGQVQIQLNGRGGPLDVNGNGMPVVNVWDAYHNYLNGQPLTPSQTDQQGQGQQGTANPARDLALRVARDRLATVMAALNAAQGPITQEQADTVMAAVHGLWANEGQITPEIESTLASFENLVNTRAGFGADMAANFRQDPTQFANLTPDTSWMNQQGQQGQSPAPQRTQGEAEVDDIFQRAYEYFDAILDDGGTLDEVELEPLMMDLTDLLSSQPDQNLRAYINNVLMGLQQRYSQAYGNTDVINVLDDAIAQRAAQQGQQPVRQPSQPGAVVGAETQVLGTDTSDAARYEVWELDRLRASHDPNNGFARNPLYPAEAQERPYHSDRGEQEKVRRNAQAYNPDFTVNTDPTATNGPPIVTDSGTVLGGNSRAMTLQLVYGENQQAADAYRQALIDHAAEFGIDPAAIQNMRQPVLVRVLNDTVPADELAARSRRYNQTTTQDVQGQAEGVSRGKLVSDGTLAALAEALGEFDTLRQFFDSVKSKAFIQQLLNDGVIQQTELSAMTDQNGLLNERGRSLVEDALRGLVVPSYDILHSLPASVIQKLDRAIPALARLKARGGEWDMTAPLTAALRIVGKANAANRKVADYLAQGSLLGVDPDQTIPAVQALAITFDNATQKEVATRIETMLAEAERTTQGQSTLLANVETTPAQAFDKAFLQPVVSVGNQAIANFDPANNPVHAAIAWVNENIRKNKTVDAAIKKLESILADKKASNEKKAQARQILGDLAGLSGTVSVYEANLGPYFTYDANTDLFGGIQTRGTETTTDTTTDTAQDVQQVMRPTDMEKAPVERALSAFRRAMKKAQQAGRTVTQGDINTLYDALAFLITQHPELRDYIVGRVTRLDSTFTEPFRQHLANYQGDQNGGQTTRGQEGTQGSTTTGRETTTTEQADTPVTDTTRAEGDTGADATAQGAGPGRATRQGTGAAPEDVQPAQPDAGATGVGADSGPSGGTDAATGQTTTTGDGGFTGSVEQRASDGRYAETVSRLAESAGDPARIESILDSFHADRVQFYLSQGMTEQQARAEADIDRRIARTIGDEVSSLENLTEAANFEDDVIYLATRLRNAFNFDADTAEKAAVFMARLIRSIGQVTQQAVNELIDPYIFGTENRPGYAGRHHGGLRDVNGVWEVYGSEGPGRDRPMIALDRDPHRMLTLAHEFTHWYITNAIAALHNNAHMKGVNPLYDQLYNDLLALARYAGVKEEDMIDRRRWQPAGNKWWHNIPQEKVATAMERYFLDPTSLPDSRMKRVFEKFRQHAYAFWSDIETKFNAFMSGLMGFRGENAAVLKFREKIRTSLLPPSVQQAFDNMVGGSIEVTRGILNDLALQLDTQFRAGIDAQFVNTMNRYMTAGMDARAAYNRTAAEMRKRLGLLTSSPRQVIDAQIDSQATSVLDTTLNTMRQVDEGLAEDNLDSYDATLNAMTVEEAQADPLEMTSPLATLGTAGDEYTTALITGLDPVIDDAINRANGIFLDNPDPVLRAADPHFDDLFITPEEEALLHDYLGEEINNQLAQDGATQVSEIVDDGNGESSVTSDEIDQTFLDEVDSYQVAWHGSGANFDRFSTDFMSTGEGGQAHGWGLYFAAEAQVSEGYRQRVLQDSTSVTVNGKRYIIEGAEWSDADTYRLVPTSSPLGRALTILKGYGYDKQQAIDAVSGYIQSDRARGDTDMALYWLQVMDILQSEDMSVSRPEGMGQLYRVNIPDSDVLLDEQQTLENQPDAVRKAVEDFLEIARDSFEDVNSAYSYMVNTFSRTSTDTTSFWDEHYNTDNLWRDVKDFIIKNGTGKALYDFMSFHFGYSDEKASRWLNEHGVKGITYEGRADGRAYVVFDDQAVDILETSYSPTIQSASQILSGAANNAQVIAAENQARLQEGQEMDRRRTATYAAVATGPQWQVGWRAALATKWRKALGDNAAPFRTWVCANFANALENFDHHPLIQSFYAVQNKIKGMSTLLYTKAALPFVQWADNMAQELGMDAQLFARDIGQYRTCLHTLEASYKMEQELNAELQQALAMAPGDEKNAAVKKAKDALDKFQRKQAGEDVEFALYGGRTRAQANSIIAKLVAQYGADVLDTGNQHLANGYTFITQMLISNGLLSSQDVANFDQWQYYCPMFTQQNSVEMSMDGLTYFAPRQNFHRYGSNSEAEDAATNMMRYMSRAARSLGLADFGKFMRLSYATLEKKGNVTGSVGQYNFYDGVALIPDEVVSGILNATSVNGSAVAFATHVKTNRACVIRVLEDDGNGGTVTKSYNVMFQDGEVRQALDGAFYNSDPDVFLSFLTKTTRNIGSLYTRLRPSFPAITASRDFIERLSYLPTKLYTINRGTPDEKVVSGARVAARMLVFIANPLNVAKLVSYQFRGTSGDTRFDAMMGDYIASGVGKSVSWLTMLRDRNKGFTKAAETALADALQPLHPTAWRRFMAVVNSWNDFFYRIPAVAQFSVMRDMGISLDSTVDGVRELMDMQQRGTGSKYLATAFPFVNSIMQTSMNVAGALGLNLAIFSGNGTAKDWANAAKGWLTFIAMIGAMRTLMPLIAESLSSGDDDGQDVLDSMPLGQVSRFIPVGDGEGGFWKLPSGFGMALFANLIAHGLDRAERGKMTYQDVGLEILTAIMREMTPNSAPAYKFSDDPIGFLTQSFTPIWAQPVVMAALNKTYSGAPISYEDYDPAARRSDQFKLTTHQNWRYIAQALYDTFGMDYTPEQVKQVVDGYCGGVLAVIPKAIEADPLYNDPMHQETRDQIGMLATFVGSTAIYEPKMNLSRKLYFNAKSFYDKRIKQDGLAPVLKGDAENKRRVLLSAGWSPEEAADYLVIDATGKDLKKLNSGLRETVKNMWGPDLDSGYIRKAYGEWSIKADAAQRRALDSMNYFRRNSAIRPRTPANPGTRMARGGVRGMPVERGNIDLYNRPVVRNDDGTISTVQTETYQDYNGLWVNYPTIGPNGERWTSQQAWENYLITGQHLGKYRTLQEAEEAAQALHEQQATLYAN